MSQVEVVDTLDDTHKQKHIHVAVQHADGARCERCWNYSEDASIVDGTKDICPRCQEVLAK